MILFNYNLINKQFNNIFNCDLLYPNKTLNSNRTVNKLINLYIKKMKNEIFD